MGWVVYDTPRPLYPLGKTRYPLCRRLGGPQGRSGRVRKISPHTGFRFPDRPALSEWLYGLSYPGHSSARYRTFLESWQSLDMSHSVLQTQSIFRHIQYSKPSPSFTKFHPLVRSVVLVFCPIVHAVFLIFISKLHSIALKCVLCIEIKFNGKEFPLRAMESYGKVKVWLHLFFYGGECLASTFGRYILGQNASGSHGIGGWVTP
jgi:hypothetical protein